MGKTRDLFKNIKDTKGLCMTIYPPFILRVGASNYIVFPLEHTCRLRNLLTAHKEKTHKCFGVGIQD